MSNHDEAHHDAGAAAAASQGPTPEHGYWRSLAELEGASALHAADAADEFPATSADADARDPLSRRNFFQVMGASLALAGVAGAGCKRWEKDYIAPLARRPEDQVPGNTQQYAGMFELGGVAQALLVTSFEGRPIKIDGNPEHPFAAGGIVPGTVRKAGTTTFAQASLLGLYDPDRSQAVRQGGAGATLDAFKAWLTEHLAKGGAAKMRVLAEASSSPTILGLRQELAAKGVVWHEWEALSHDNEREGLRAAFGRPLRALPKLDAAETIVAIDGDMFTHHPAALRLARDFARSRRADGGSLGHGRMNRLWAIESVFSSTGASADHRLPVRSGQILPVLQSLDAALGGGGVVSAEFLGDAKVKQFLAVLVEELRANRGRAVLVCGPRQPPAVHALVAKINAALDAAPTTLEYREDPAPERVAHAASLDELRKAIAAKQVETLVILGGNPVYDAPADADFAAALATVATSIHLSEYVNETSAVCTWHLPRAHALETWTDGRTWDGTITIGQPMIQPMYGGIAATELLGLLLGREATASELIRKGLGLDGLLNETAWRQAIHDGFTQVGGLAVAQVGAPAAVPGGTGDSASVLANGALEVVFVPSSHTYDGRFANCAWLQELPDFLTKVTWDNYAMVSPATATELGLRNDTIIKVEVEGRSIEVACYTMPGQARYSIALVLGGGRTKAGKVGGDGRKQVGFDTGKIRTLASLGFGAGARVSSTGRGYQLANTQEHWDYRAGLKIGFLGIDGAKVRDEGIAKRLPTLVREVEASEYQGGAWKAIDHGTFKPGDFFDEPKRAEGETARGYSLFQEKEYKGHQWAMATDLSGCVGCNACIVACASENNTPMVGKQQVINNREMHWLRIDRYFTGPIDDPEVASQPVGCQHCENAPCEQVCPVAATAHSDEGLNEMAYNRCVGTRYCANNCPYKARRFNYFDYHLEFEDARNKVRKLLFNPEVTVRARGVMEKCTFCVQRIQNAKIGAKREGRELTDGAITTACQDACPTEAIVFGDLADKNSRVSKLHAERRSYGLLDDVLNTQPRNQYLARVKNPHPKLAKPKPDAHGGHGAHAAPAAAGHGAAPTANPAHQGGH
jgi:MoCo/4Fe-4S cofactor protein with predicted Tat translocation signal